MLAHQRFRRAGVARFQRLHDLPVLALGVQDARAHVDPADEADALVDGDKLAHDLAIPRQPGDPRMEGLVVFDNLADGLALVVETARIECFLDGRDPGIAGAFAGHAHGGGFQHRAHLVQFMDMPGIEFAAEEALARLEIDELFRDQPVQRLAQRRPAGVQVAGKLHLVDPLSGPDAEIDRHFLEPLVERLDPAFAHAAPVLHACHLLDTAGAPSQDTELYADMCADGTRA